MVNAILQLSEELTQPHCYPNTEDSRPTVVQAYESRDLELSPPHGGRAKD